ncbi:Exopolyphosphatase [Zalaria obscura]|uniref:Exopolyphosphatase n=1 Tax=Zalaria obscura TaxID=2024903 RepID=A0ACC3SAH8_9PEZI
MAVPRGSLRSFLSRAKSALRSSISNKSPLTLVIGNESADLDSITCSILYAYLQSSAPTAGRQVRLHVPLLNIPRADIALRPELLALLPHANVDADHLITLDDLPDLARIGSELPPDITRWILVDHNALQGTLGSVYSKRVVGVIDHHDDEGKVPQDTGDEPRIITKSGSCTSLVTNYSRDAWDRLSTNALSSGAAHGQDDSLADDSAVTTLWDAQVAHLAMASILIDTHDLTDENKTTDHDRKAVEYLAAKVNMSPRISKDFDRGMFFTKLSDAKRDVDSLSLTDILRKDYKQWSEGDQTLGMSSVVKPVDYLQRKASEATTQQDGKVDVQVSERATTQQDSKVDGAFMGAIKDFAAERNLDIFGIMTTFTADDGSFARELLVISPSETGATSVKKFVDNSSAELKLEEVDGRNEDKTLLRYWRQKNVSCSRKQVAPMLRKAMSMQQ